VSTLLDLGWTSQTSSDRHGRQQGLEVRFIRLSKHRRRATINFMLTELRIGLIFCDFVRSARKNPERYLEDFEHARQALRITPKYMRKF
jgi:hypothetical protein